MEVEVSIFLWKKLGILVVLLLSVFLRILCKRSIKYVKNLHFKQKKAEYGMQGLVIKFGQFPSDTNYFKIPTGQKKSAQIGSVAKPFY